PSITDSLRLARQTALVVATTPALVAAEDEEQQASIMTALRAQQEVITGLIDALESEVRLAADPVTPPQLIEGIRDASRELAAVLERLDRSVARQLALRTELAQRRTFAVELHRRLTEKLTPLLDDATMYLVTGYRTLDEVAPVPHELRLSQA